MKLLREKAGVISLDAVWVLFTDCYMYTAPTLFGLLRVVVREWEDDRHLVG